eukprot:1446109-Pyramimonas_sp.AAC.1
MGYDVLTYLVIVNLGGRGQLQKLKNGAHPHNIRLVRRENILALPASDWSNVRIYSRLLRPIGPS